MPTGARFSCSLSSSPCLRIPSSFVAPTTSPSTAEHQERTLVGMFLLFGGFLTPPFTSNTQNTPIWACFSCSTAPLPPQHPPIWKTRHNVAFFVLAGSPHSHSSPHLPLKTQR